MVVARDHVLRAEIQVRTNGSALVGLDKFRIALGYVVRSGESGKKREHQNETQQMFHRIADYSCETILTMDEKFRVRHLCPRNSRLRISGSRCLTPNSVAISSAQRC